MAIPSLVLAGITLTVMLIAGGILKASYEDDDTRGGSKYSASSKRFRKTRKK